MYDLSITDLSLDKASVLSMEDISSLLLSSTENIQHINDKMYSLHQVVATITPILQVYNTETISSVKPMLLQKLQTLKSSVLDMMQTMPDNTVSTIKGKLSGLLHKAMVNDPTNEDHTDVLVCFYDTKYIVDALHALMNVVDNDDLSGLYNVGYTVANGVFTRCQGTGVSNLKNMYYFQHNSINDLSYITTLVVDLCYALELKIHNSKQLLDRYNNITDKINNLNRIDLSVTNAGTTVNNLVSEIADVTLQQNTISFISEQVHHYATLVENVWLAVLNK